MGRPKASVPTERLCVTLPADEVKKAKGAAAAAGVMWADFVRQALLSQAALESGRPIRKAAETLKVRGSITTPDGTRMEYPRETGARVPVVGHRHSAAKTIAGGIAVCECGARRVLGSDWRMP